MSVADFGPEGAVWLEFGGSIATDVIHLSEEDVLERIKEITHGQGPDAVIDCVGMEASAGGHGVMGMLSAVQETLTSSQRPYALEQMITAVRPCGIVSVPGVYGGPVPVNMGSVVQKGLTMRSGQTHVKRYLEPLTKLIQDGTIDRPAGIGSGVRRTLRRRRRATRAMSDRAPLAGQDIVCFAGEDWWFHNPHSNLHIMQAWSARNRM